MNEFAPGPLAAACAEPVVHTDSLLDPARTLAGTFASLLDPQPVPLAWQIAYALRELRSGQHTIH